MATWPTSLPSPSLEGYGLTAGNPVIRTDMESGPARVRRRFTAAPDTVTLRFTFTDAQMAAFRTFWNTDAQQGAAWFYLTLRDGRSAGDVTREVRPTSGAFNASLLSTGIWAVSFSVEVRNA